jgi:hypothetical protein
MPFPWELHLDRPYHHENWPLPERLSRDRSTDSLSEHSTAKLGETANKDGGAEKAADSDRKGCDEPMPQRLNKIDHKLR